MDIVAQNFVTQAAEFLDKPNFLLRASTALGKPFEYALEALPSKHQNLIHRASQMALNRGLLLVTQTLPGSASARAGFQAGQVSSLWAKKVHSFAAFGAGAAGGFFGLMALPVELPITTGIMLRSIAAIAQDYGMDLQDPQVQLECLYILSLGSARAGEQPVTSVYWASRTAFAKVSKEAVQFLMGKGSKDFTAPVLVKFVASVASRFEVVVSEKFLVEALPIVGALGGGAINAAFTNYFSEAAHFHFGLRALEKQYGVDKIESLFHAKRGNHD